jgi:two-component system, chemotaxis family, sensor kinase CheA
MNSITTKTKLLVVDDDEATRILIIEILEDMQLSFLESSSGKDAISQFREYSSDIILVMLDIHLPDHNGFYLLEQFRNIKPFVPAIAISALAPSALAPQCSQAGFNAYLSKPFDIEELWKTVNTQLISIFNS